MDFEYLRTLLTTPTTTDLPTNIDDILEAIESLGEETNRALMEKAAFESIKNNHHAVLTCLINKKGVNARAFTSTAERREVSLLYVAALKGNIEIIQTLLDCGADINCATSDGATPLHAAASAGHSEAIKTLLNNGANIDCTASDGATPLHFAAAKGHVEATETLLERRATVDRQTTGKRTPLHGAALLEDPLIIRVLIGHGAFVDHPDIDGATPLHAAALKGNVSAITTLIELRANFNHEAKYGVTPLLAAKFGGHASAVKFLMDAGGVFSKVDSEAETAKRGLKDEEFDPSVSDEKKEEVKKIFQELVAQNERWSANRAAWVKAVTTSSIARSASSASAEALVPPNKRGKKGK